MSFYNMAFPEQVKYVHMALQLSRTELAEKIGVFCATVGHWEREN